MKRFRRIISFAFSIVMLFACLTLNGAAVFEPIDSTMIGQDQQAEEIKGVVEEYLGNVARNMYLYEDNDIVEKTIQEFPENIRKDVSIDTTVFEKSRDNEYNAFTDGIGVERPAEKLTADSIDFMNDKVSYYKTMRATKGFSRDNFTTSYDFDEVIISENTARIRVYESVCFTYSGQTEDSFVGTWYEIYLTKISGAWYIIGVNSNDSSDAIFKAESFNLDVALDSINYSTEPQTEQAEMNSLPETGATSNTISDLRTYNRTYAKRYAYTYSSNTIGTQYNSNFHSNAGNGGDCMNFASQCVWAGFWGNNTSNAISSRAVPMDTIGSCNWYPGNNWDSCSAFRNYTATLNASTENGVVTSCYTIPCNQNSFSSIANYSTRLLGSVLHVRGTGANAQPDQYGHAVVVTNVAGNTRDDIYICAHTRDMKNISLGDNWAASSIYYDAIYVIIPESYRTVTTCPTSNHSYDSYTAGNGTDAICNMCGYNRMYVHNVLKDPIPVNSTVSLSGYTTINAYRMAMSVTSPSGTTTWLGEAMNTNAISASYTFTQTGSYTITTLARDIYDAYSSSTTASHTFVIKVY